MVCTLGLLAAGIYGTTKLEVNYSFLKDYYNDVARLEIEEGSYQDKYRQAQEHFFPTRMSAWIYMGNLDFPDQKDNLVELVKELDALDLVELPFEETWVSAVPPGVNLFDFVTSPLGLPYAAFFNVSEESQEVLAAKIPFYYIRPHPISVAMDLMDEVDALVEAKVALLISMWVIFACTGL